MARRQRKSKPIKKARDVKRMIAYLEASSPLFGLRNSLLFQLGCTTGYRAGDLVKLTVGEVREAIEVGYFLIMEGKKENSKNIRKKNRKPREAELRPKLRNKLRKYINDMEDYEYIFKSNKGDSHITVDSVSRILREAGKFLGLVGTSSHCMRKTYAYKLYLASDRDVLYVKEKLGHSSIEETKLYLDLESDRYSECSAGLDDFL